MWRAERNNGGNLNRRNGYQGYPGEKSGLTAEQSSVVVLGRLCNVTAPSEIETK